MRGAAQGVVISSVSMLSPPSPGARAGRSSRACRRPASPPRTVVRPAPRSCSRAAAPRASPTSACSACSTAWASAPTSSSAPAWAPWSARSTPAATPAGSSTRSPAWCRSPRSSAPTSRCAPRSLGILQPLVVWEQGDARLRAAERLGRRGRGQRAGERRHAPREPARARGFRLASDPVPRRRHRSRATGAGGAAVGRPGPGRPRQRRRAAALRTRAARRPLPRPTAGSRPTSRWPSRAREGAERVIVVDATEHPPRLRSRLLPAARGRPAGAVPLPAAGRLAAPGRPAASGPTWTGSPASTSPAGTSPGCSTRASAPPTRSCPGSTAACRATDRRARALPDPARPASGSTAPTPPSSSRSSRLLGLGPGKRRHARLRAAAPARADPGRRVRGLRVRLARAHRGRATRSRSISRSGAPPAASPASVWPTTTSSAGGCGPGWSIGGSWIARSREAERSFSASCGASCYARISAELSGRPPALQADAHRPAGQRGRPAVRRATATSSARPDPRRPSASPGIERSLATGLGSRGGSWRAGPGTSPTGADRSTLGAARPRDRRPPGNGDACCGPRRSGPACTSGVAFEGSLATRLGVVRLTPRLRLGWGDGLPLQLGFPLGGDDGFPGLSHRRAPGRSGGDAGRCCSPCRCKGPLLARLELAAGGTDAESARFPGGRLDGRRAGGPRRGDAGGAGAIRVRGGTPRAGRAVRAAGTLVLAGG